jgi:hypothetical protein
LLEQVTGVWARVLKPCPDQAFLLGGTMGIRTPDLLPCHPSRGDVLQPDQLAARLVAASANFSQQCRSLPVFSAAARLVRPDPAATTLP